MKTPGPINLSCKNSNSKSNVSSQRRQNKFWGIAVQGDQ